MTKQFTPEEVRRQMAEHMRLMVKYWAELPGLSIEDRCDGVAFSAFTMLDGVAAMPRMTLAIQSEPESEYVDGQVINDDADLHDVYAEIQRDQGK